MKLHIWWLTRSYQLKKKSKIIWALLFIKVWVIYRVNFAISSSKSQLLVVMSFLILSLEPTVIIYLSGILLSPPKKVFIWYHLGYILGRFKNSFFAGFASISSFRFYLYLQIGMHPLGLGNTQSSCLRLNL